MKKYIAAGSLVLSLATPALAIDLRSWDTKIAKTSTTTRFVVLAAFANAAVLDKETQLVWERQPELSLWPYASAALICGQKGVGGRGGWRVPKAFELTSLVDPALSTIPRLPDGHPFLNVATMPRFWASDNLREQPGYAIAVNFDIYLANGVAIFEQPQSLPQRVWCVRGAE